MISMSGGQWSYNRFESYEQKLAEAKKAKKDYDGDGKVESSKDEYFGSKDKAIKKAMGKDSDSDECEKCGGKGCDHCGGTGKHKKEEVKENREMAYGGGKPGKGSGDGSKPKGLGGKGVYTMKGKDGKPLFKEENIDESSCGSTGYQKGGEVKPKKKVVKEDVINHLIENQYVTNEVSAEVLFDHMSDQFLESIEEDILEGFKDPTQPTRLGGMSPNMKMNDKQIQLQKSEPGSKREKKQSKVTNLMNKTLHSGANMARRNS